MNYYYLKDENTEGPLSLGDLKDLYQRGEIFEDTQVCTEESQEWTTLSVLLGGEAPGGRQKIEHVASLPVPPPIPGPQYTVVPFTAVIGQKDTAATAAKQLEVLIQSYSRNGWEYIRLETVETHVHGDSGCFGIGAAPSRTIVYWMAVFKK